MTIRATTPAYTDPTTRTQATSYYEGLADRLADQAKNNTPRSQSAWGAEQSRLGSWNTGVGTLSPSGVGNSYTNGQARPLFENDPDSANTGNNNANRSTP